MRVLLLVSAFNGLSQRAWCALREAGHDVGVLARHRRRCAGGIIAGVRAAQPELIICPFLKHRVPAEVWQHWRTIIIHPGPVGDRARRRWTGRSPRAPGPGASPRCRRSRRWTPVRSGPPGRSRCPPRRRASPSLYNGPVADAAMECIHEVLAKAADPAFRPVPTATCPPRCRAASPETGLRPLMRQPDRAFDWSAADRAHPAPDPGGRRRTGGAYRAGRSRGVRLRRASRPTGGPPGGAPGHAARPPAGRGAGGHRRRQPLAGPPAGRRCRGIKLPATRLLGRRLRDVPRLAAAAGHRAGDAVGVPAGPLPADRPGRLADLRLLQRRDGHRALPAAARRGSGTPRRRTPRCWCCAAARTRSATASI